MKDSNDFQKSTTFGSTFDESSNSILGCHGVELKYFEDASDQDGVLYKLLKSYLCVNCHCIPIPDDSIVKCENCDSLVCSSKSAELKLKCPNCEYLGMKYNKFTVVPLNNRIILNNLSNLKIKCSICHNRKI